MKITDATAKLKLLTAKAVKIGAETDAQNQRIADLEAAIEAGAETTPEFDAALLELEAEMDKVDAKVDDAPTA